MAGTTAREEVLGLLMGLVSAEPVDAVAALLLVGAALSERDARISDLTSEVARLKSILGNDSTNCGATTAVDRSSATGGRRSLGETDGDADGMGDEAGDGSGGVGVGVDGETGTSDTGADVGGEAGVDSVEDGDDGSEGERPRQRLQRAKAHRAQARRPARPQGHDHGD